MGVAFDDLWPEIKAFKNGPKKPSVDMPMRTSDLSFGLGAAIEQHGHYAPQEYCQCAPDLMVPSNTAERQVKHYFERLCLACDCWISYKHMDRYNQYYGFSGYDEVNDD